MRLYDLYEDDDSNQMRAVAAEVVANCQQWIRETNNLELEVYRGMKGKRAKELYVSDIGRIVEIGPIEDRAPKDSSNATHKFFMNLIRSQRLVANRDNSVFCTGNKDQATAYGPIHIVIPVDGYQYTWNKKIKDLYTFHSSYADALYSVDEGELKKKYVELLNALKENKVYDSKAYDKLRGEMYLKHVYTRYNDEEKKKLGMEIAGREVPLDKLPGIILNFFISTAIPYRLITELNGDPVAKKEIQAHVKELAKKIKPTPAMRREAMLNARSDLDKTDNTRDPDVTHNIVGRYFTDSELDKAIKSGHEIMLKSDRCFAIHLNLWKKFKYYCLQELRKTRSSDTP